MLDPDMPADQLLLHLGEMTPQEMRTARAAIRLANNAIVQRFDAVVLAYKAASSAKEQSSD